MRVYSADGVYAFKRSSESESVLVVINAGDKSSSIVPDGTEVRGAAGQVLFGKAEFKAAQNGAQITIPARQAAVIQL